MGDTIASGVIPCQIASKSNSRRQVRWRGSPRFIKSKPALAFMEAAAMSIPTLAPLYEGLVTVRALCVNRDRRPDLDPALLMDALQGRIYQNDRQVYGLVAIKTVDKDNPRVEWSVEMGVDL
jgi:Holliday junction resolvase RusA-like endonuclease